MKIFKIVFGAILALASLWLGSYFCGTLPYDHWASSPSFITACLGFIGGVALVTNGIL
jgi:hypothetical protein